jgi:hypothetical protein
MARTPTAGAMSPRPSFRVSCGRALPGLGGAVHGGSGPFCTPSPSSKMVSWFSLAGSAPSHRIRDSDASALVTSVPERPV